jgi:hypothetical protein
MKLPFVPEFLPMYPKALKLYKHTKARINVYRNSIPESQKEECSKTNELMNGTNKM